MVNIESSGVVNWNGQCTETQKDYSTIVDDFIEVLIEDYNAQEQRKILIEVNDKLIKYYEIKRQEHIEEVEKYSKRIKEVKL